MTARDEFSVRPLRADEWALLRRLRLAALADAPDAFGPTLADARERPDSYWRTWARGMAEGSGDLFVAERSGEPAGLVSALADGEAVGHIGAMWVAPAARGSGLGRRLLDTALGALEARGCQRIVLSVTETNTAARALYARSGFRESGRWKPLRDGSPLRDLEMTRP